MWISLDNFDCIYFPISQLSSPQWDIIWDNVNKGLISALALKHRNTHVCLVSVENLTTTLYNIVLRCALNI